MGIRYTHFYDEFQGLLDSLLHDSDESQRLANTQRMYKDATKLLLRARDEAAYDLRTRYASKDAAALSDISARHIDYWANRHRERNSLPPLRRVKRLDLSEAMDLSDISASPQS
jgi:hypothetical protein